MSSGKQRFATASGVVPQGMINGNSVKIAVSFRPTQFQEIKAFAKEKDIPLAEAVRRLVDASSIRV